MSQTQPISPDDVYCIYCHAPAAGVCAVCGALCCGDCVELVMGVTTRRATCRHCLAQGRMPAGAWTLVRTVAPVLAGIAALLLLAVYLLG